MSLAYPAALFLPLLVPIALLITRPRRSSAVGHGHVGILGAVGPSLRMRLRRPVLAVLLTTALALAGLAAARPQKVTVVAAPTLGRNLMLAIDLSKSMAADDFRVGYRAITRLEATKEVTARFLAERAHDRIGIVVFGSAAFVQSPLTLDHLLLEQLVQRLDYGLAGDGTAIGDGLGLALKRVADLPANSRSIILLTDGVSNAGTINPIKAAKVARDLGVRVHTIGIGSKDQRNLRQRSWSMFGGAPPPEFDEKTLREIAEITGGEYFHAMSVEGFERIYGEINKLEETSAESPAKLIPMERFAGFVLAGLASYMVCLLLANTVFLKLP